MTTFLLFVLASIIGSLIVTVIDRAMWLVMWKLRGEANAAT